MNSHATKQGGEDASHAIDHAKALAARGFHVFPCRGKIGCTDWPNKATRNPKEWQSKDDGPETFKPFSNVGIFTGKFGDNEALIVVDIDTLAAHGKDGAASLKAWEAENGKLPDTLKAKTAGGGEHQFYRVPTAVASGVDVLGPGIDIRSAGGLVVAPGSRVGGKSYAWLNDLPLAIAPQLLIDACSQPRTKDPKAREKVAHIDLARARKLATEYLQTDAPEAVEHNGSDQITFSVACRVRDFGVPESECVQLMMEFWPSAEGFTPNWVAEKVRNAYEYARGREGGDTPQAVFEPVQVETKSDEFPDNVPRVQLVSAADVKMEAIRWVWPNWIARGKLHLIAGAPMTSKTTIAMSWAAAVSAGTAFPDGSKPKTGHVVIWSGEDSAADTLAPRLAAAGADLRRVHFVSDVHTHGQVRGFDPARDVPALTAALADMDDVRMIIVDPIVAAVQGDSHKNAEVRRGLQPLVDLAQRMDAALIGITHYSKGTQGREPLERIIGSMAFAAVARIAYGTQIDKAEDAPPGRHIMVRVKSNIGPHGGGFQYTTEGHAVGNGIASSRIAWGDPIDGDARELLEDAEGKSERVTATDRAVAFLREVLAAGPRLAAEVKRLAGDAHHAVRTVERAMKRHEFTSELRGCPAVATWALRSPEFAPPTTVDPFT